MNAFSRLLLVLTFAELGLSFELSAQNVKLAKVDNISSASLVSGSRSLMSVDLTGPAPAGGVVVSMDHGAASGPKTVTIPAGSWSENFEPVMPAVSVPTTVTISATYAGITKSLQVTVTPPVLWSISVPQVSVVSGTLVTGTVGLLGPAGPAGVRVSLNHGSGTGSATVTVLPGQGSATFQTGTPKVSAPTMVAISASYEGVSKSASISVVPAPVSVASLVVIPAAARAGPPGSPPAVYGSQGRLQGTVTLSEAATGLVTLPLTSSSAAAQVPASITVPAAQTSAVFTITTSRVESDALVTVSVGQGNAAKTATLTVKPWPPLFMSFNTMGMPSSMVGGTDSSAVIRCGCQTYSLSLDGDRPHVVSSNPSVLTVTAGTFDIGMNWALIAIRTQPVATPTSVVITASYTGTVITKSITVEPELHVALLRLNPATIFEAGTTAGTVTLSTPAPSGGVTVKLSSSSSSVTAPATVTVPPGQTSAPFTATATSLGASTIVAQVGSGVEKRAALNVVTIEVQGLDLPTTLSDGGTGTGTVVLNAPAIAPLTVALASSDPVVRVPPNVTVSAGSTSKSFPIFATGSGPALITAKRAGGTVERKKGITVVTVGDRGGQSAAVTSIELRSGEIRAGSTATGSVNLGAPAPPGGATVSLSTTSRGLVVQARVSIPAGSTSGTFTVRAAQNAPMGPATIEAALISSRGVPPGAKTTAVIKIVR